MTTDVSSVPACFERPFHGVEEQKSAVLVSVVTLRSCHFISDRICSRCHVRQAGASHYSMSDFGKVVEKTSRVQYAQILTRFAIRLSNIELHGLIQLSRPLEL